MNSHFVKAVLIVGASAQYTGLSPKESFAVQSADMNAWSSTGEVGAILGFITFGVLFLFTVVSIFYDNSQRSKAYDEMIEDDLQEMKRLGMDKDMAEIKKELAVRLSGQKVEYSGDDQLLGEAVKLTHEQYKKYL